MISTYVKGQKDKDVSDTLHIIKKAKTKDVSQETSRLATHHHSKPATHHGERDATTQARNQPTHASRRLHLTESLSWQDPTRCDDYAVESLSLAYLFASCTMHLLFLSCSQLLLCSWLRHERMMPIYSCYRVKETQMNKNILIPYLFSWRLLVLQFQDCAQDHKHIWCFH